MFLVDKPVLISALYYVDISIYILELLGEGGPSIPVTIPIPESVKAYGIATVQGLFGRIRSYYVETTGVGVWE